MSGPQGCAASCTAVRRECGPGGVETKLADRRVWLLRCTAAASDHTRDMGFFKGRCLACSNDRDAKTLGFKRGGLG